MLIRRWFSPREIASYLGIAPKSVYDMVASGKIPAARVGRLVRIDLRALEQQLESQINKLPTFVK